MYTLYTMSLEIGRPSGYFVLCFSIGHPSTVHIFWGIWTWVVVIATMLEGEKNKSKVYICFQYTKFGLFVADWQSWVTSIGTHTFHIL